MNPVARRVHSEAFGKVWGSPLTEPWYRNPEGRKIGEVWFSASPAVPLLVKLLFTSENLSVQVHPDDEYASRHENSRGKTEMWHVLRAEPEARVASGLRVNTTPEELRQASLDGRIMDLLNWVPARAGDMFFIPAGTVHAIGGGLVLCEIQQISDVTYRLYDYGRGRDLHLEKAMDVSHLHPRQALLEQCPYFRTDRLHVRGSATVAERAKSTLYIAVAGSGTISGEPFKAGEAWELDSGAERVQIESPDATFVLASEP